MEQSNLNHSLGGQRTRTHIIVMKVLKLPFGILFLGVLLASQGSGDEVLEKVQNLQHLDCRKILGAIVKTTLKTWKSCTQEVKKTTKTLDELQEKFQCIMKCSLGKLGVLNEENKVTPVTRQKFMDRFVPPEAHELGVELVKGCIKLESEMRDDDPLCNKYGDYIQCIQNALGDFAEKINCTVIGFG